MHVCLFVGEYVCACMVCMLLHVCVRAFLTSVHVFVHECVRLYVHVCMFVRVGHYVDVCVHVCMCVCMSVV